MSLYSSSLGTFIDHALDIILPVSITAVAKKSRLYVDMPSLPSNLVASILKLNWVVFPSRSFFLDK